MDSLAEPDIERGNLVWISEIALTNFAYCVVPPTNGKISTAAASFRNWIKTQDFWNLAKCFHHLILIGATGLQGQGRYKRGNNSEHKKAISNMRRLSSCYYTVIFGCGGRIWPCDLQVMSLTEMPWNPRKPGIESVWCYRGAMTNLLFILVLWDP